MVRRSRPHPDPGLCSRDSAPKLFEIKILPVSV